MPETWAGLLAGDTRYLLPLTIPAVRTGPAAGVPPVLLSHYLGAGYALDFETRRLELNSEPMLRVLSFYDQAQEQGQLDERPEELTGVEGARQFYEANTDAIIQTSAGQYLTEREQNPGLSIGPAPGWSSPSPPIASGWVLAVVTPDPERQQRAAELLTWLVAPERNGRWTAATGWLPVSSEGWSYREDDPNATFLDGQLKVAAPLPVGAESAAAALALQQAALSVVRDDVSPVEAASQALNATQ
jgi:ABC-type glycerol-3-phosphate transport system substrate-binding protein